VAWTSAVVSRGPLRARRHVLDPTPLHMHTTVASVRCLLRAGGRCARASRDLYLCDMGAQTRTQLEDLARNRSQRAATSRLSKTPVGRAGSRVSRRRERTHRTRRAGVRGSGCMYYVRMAHRSLTRMVDTGHGSATSHSAVASARPLAFDGRERRDRSAEVAACAKSWSWQQCCISICF